MSAQDLIPSISIAGLLQARDAVMDRVNEAMRLMNEAGEIAIAARIESPIHVLTYADRYGLTKFDEICRKHLDASAWKLLLDESGMRSMLDATARKEWDEAIYSRKTAPLTREAIAGTFGQLIEDRGAMFDRGVIECYRGLNWDYKTNQGAAFGKRLVVKVYYNGSDKLDDLVRVMSVLDGKPQPDHRNGMWSLIEKARQGSQAFETPYFTGRTFRNQNVHLTFTRMDLIDRMNGILAKHYGASLPRAGKPKPNPRNANG